MHTVHRHVRPTSAERRRGAGHARYSDPRAFAHLYVPGVHRRRTTGPRPDIPAVNSRVAPGATGLWSR